MIECQSTSRHLIKWLMDKMDVHKDGLFLAVTKALDQGTGMVSSSRVGDTPLLIDSYRHQQQRQQDHHNHHHHHQQQQQQQQEKGA
jgi:hypothetical protein